DCATAGCRAARRRDSPARPGARAPRAGHDRAQERRPGRARPSRVPWMPCSRDEGIGLQTGEADLARLHLPDDADGAIGIIWEVEAREIRFARLEADTLVP